MKKIPTLFVRIFDKNKIVGIENKVSDPSLECFISDDESINGIATVKYDGACCMIKDDVLYKRYDAKKGKTPPEGAIPCCEPDPVTGHHPHWVECKESNPADKWFFKACSNYMVMYGHIQNGTYEAIGPHFQGNPYKLQYDTLRRHGIAHITVERTFDGIKDYLTNHEIEGIVFWKDGEPRCKIKRSDFGLPWPV